MKKIIVIVLSAILAVSLSSCTFDENAIKDFVDKIPDYIDDLTLDELTFVIPENESEYEKIYNAYHTAHVTYFEKMSKELKSINNLKYNFSNTVHKLGETSIESSAIFFEDDSDNVDYHYNILGYENRTFEKTNNTAVFTGNKNGSDYRIELTYDTGTNSFVYIVTKDGELNECLSVVVGESNLLRAYYNKDLGYIYEIASDSDGNVNMSWGKPVNGREETYLTPYTIAAVDSFASPSLTNYIVFNNGELSGEIKE